MPDFLHSVGIRIVVGEDQPFLEIIPELISAYGSAMEYGHQYIYQAMPRMLTIWFDFGSYCLAVKAKTNKVSPHTLLGKAQWEY